jgi:hypothetical protein
VILLLLGFLVALGVFGIALLLNFVLGASSSIFSRLGR